MAKKNKQLKAVELNKDEAITSSKEVVEKAQPQGNKWWLWPGLIGLICILLYSNTFQHRFVIDDDGIVRGNKITKAPVSWENTKTIFSTSLRKGQDSDLENTLYRPFVKLMFNLEWNAFDGDPHMFHIVNSILYAITCIFLFMVLYRIFDKKWLLPFLISLLFAVHPLHVETVANVKSGDEVFSLLGILISLRCIQLYLDKAKIVYIIFAALSFLMASFSKESTVVAVAIFPLFIYYFTSANLRKNIILSSVFAACSGLFLYCRWAALHVYKEGTPVSLMDNYMANYRDDFWGRLPSAINSLGAYLKIFLIPHPLSSDYSFSTFSVVPVTNPHFLISFIILTSLFIYAIILFKKKDKIGFGLFWFFISISIVSNIFFLIGTSFGERLMFTPSVGLCMAMVLLLFKLIPAKGENQSNMVAAIKNSPAAMIVLFVSLLFSYKTYHRNEDWSSNFKLLSTDLQNYPNSTHLLYHMANSLSDDFRKGMTTENMLQENFSYAQINDSIQRDNRQAIQYFMKSLSIFPALPSEGYNQLGKAYFNLGNVDSASKYYFMAMKRDSTIASYTNNVGTILFLRAMRDATNARQKAIEGKIDSADIYQLMAKTKIQNAKTYFLRAFQIDSSNADFSNNLGSAYGESRMPDSAIYWFSKAAQIDEYDTTSRKFLDLTYRGSGDLRRADSAHHELIMASQKSRERMNKNKY